MSVAQFVEAVTGGSLPFRVVAYDGSVAGPEDAALTLRVVRRDALSRVLTRPGQLGVARAYVAGDVALDGRVYDLFALRGPTLGLETLAALARLLREVGPSVLVPVAPPAIESQPRGWLHSRARDARAVTYHYDVSNRFYELVLGRSLVYSCAVFDAPSETLEDAQLRKVDLVCRKLGLDASSRLLDVGCGWGTLAIHAARTYGCRVVGVTLSAPQRELAARRAAAAGVDELVEFRVQDYRDVDDGPFDAISSIGMSEHVGRRALEAYAVQLAALVRPGGRLLNHAIGRPATRGDGSPRGRTARLARRVEAAAGLSRPSRMGSPFIRRYVFPDGELHEVGALVSLLQGAGFELRHLESLREHYALTLRRWVANLEARHDEAVAEVGAPRAAVWRLYMAASAVAFERHQLEVHQALCVRPDTGRAGLSLRPRFEPVVDVGWLGAATTDAAGQGVASPRR
jgi:cyclopropane-fatty-acyl-phospholipid synthase